MIMRYKELAQRFDIPFPDGMHRAQQAQAEQAHDAALHAAVTPLMADPAIPILCVVCTTGRGGSLGKMYFVFIWSERGGNIIRSGGAD